MSGLCCAALGFQPRAEGQQPMDQYQRCDHASATKGSHVSDAKSSRNGGVVKRESPTSLFVCVLAAVLSVSLFPC